MVSVLHQSTARTIREQTDPMLSNGSQYFDIIHWPFCAAPLKVERAYCLGLENQIEQTRSRNIYSEYVTCDFQLVRLEINKPQKSNKKTRENSQKTVVFDAYVVQEKLSCKGWWHTRSHYTNIAHYTCESMHGVTKMQDHDSWLWSNLRRFCGQMRPHH